MQKLTITLTAVAFALAASVLTASAQNQSSGASGLHAQIQNATPIKNAACRGWGPWCPPGRVRRCGPYRCWCVPCW
jgi:hypothetical protein